MAEQQTPDTGAGHRQRLRQRFIKAGLAGLSDYEVVELLLTLGTPRADCKQPAKEAIRRFKGLRGVLEASPEELQEIPGIGPSNAFGIRLVREVAGQYLKEKAKELPFCGSSQAVFDYLYHNMRGLKKEVFKALYLDSQNRLLEAEDISSGTVNMSAVFTREVMAAALKHHAAALIFVHNHPSGNPTPSPEDRAITRELTAAARLMQIKVLDHIIIGDGCFFSFAGQGMLEA
jgi:DNA repair protein RadC